MTSRSLQIKRNSLLQKVTIVCHQSYISENSVSKLQITVNIVSKRIMFVLLLSMSFLSGEHEFQNFLGVNIKIKVLPYLGMHMIAC